MATDGATYDEEARHGQEVLEMMVRVMRDKGEPYPPPNLIEY